VQMRLNRGKILSLCRTVLVQREMDFSSSRLSY
jgi:hypothetical protein